MPSQNNSRTLFCKWTAGFVLLFSSAGFGQVPCRTLSSALDQVVCREKEFAKESVAKGMKAAFLGFLSETGILFRPDPVQGIPWIQSRPDTAMLLSWEPAFAGISCSGDLGYTLGPYRVQDPSRLQPPGYGQYFTIWKKEADSQWKVLLDFGISYEGQPADPVSFHEEKFSCRDRQEPGNSSGEIWRKTDEDFSQAQIALGSKKAYGRVLSDESWLLWEGRQPRQGRKPNLSYLPERDRQARILRWEQRGAGGSLAGDLGYSYGLLKDSLERKGNYVRLWRSPAPGRMHLLVEVAVLRPGQKSKAN